MLNLTVLFFSLFWYFSAMEGISEQCLFLTDLHRMLLVTDSILFPMLPESDLRYHT